MRPGHLVRTYALLVAMVLIWSSYPALVKLALRDLPPLTIAALRCLVATGMLAFLAWRAPDEGGAITRADLPTLVFLGVTGITLSSGSFYLAVAYTTAANASILTAAAPVLVAVLGHLFLGERLARLRWLGVAVSALGVILTVTRGDPRLVARPPSLGDGIAVLSQLGWAAYTLVGKRVLVRLSPRAATLAAYLVGTAVLVPVSILLAPLFPPPRLGSGLAWAVVLYQGTLGTLSHVWFYRGVQTVGPAATAIFMNLQPLFGVALAAGLVGERITLAQVAGCALILGGVWLTTRSVPGPAPARS